MNLARQILKLAIPCLLLLAMHAGPVDGKTQKRRKDLRAVFPTIDEREELLQGSATFKLYAGRLTIYRKKEGAMDAGQVPVEDISISLSKEQVATFVDGLYIEASPLCYAVNPDDDSGYGVGAFTIGELTLYDADGNRRLLLGIRPDGFKVDDRGGAYRDRMFSQYLAMFIDDLVLQETGTRLPVVFIDQLSGIDCLRDAEKRYRSRTVSKVDE